MKKKQNIAFTQHCRKIATLPVTFPYENLRGFPKKMLQENNKEVVERMTIEIAE